MLVYSEKFDKLFKSSKLYQSGVLDKLRILADSKRKPNNRSYDYNNMSLDYSYVGGGAILDSVMGKEIKDIDFF